MRKTLAFASLMGCIMCGTSARAETATESPAYFCKPGEPCWPTAAEWQQLAASLRGALEVPLSPLSPCIADARSAACATALDELKNPFAIQERAGGTESVGWLDAWTAAQSAYAVKARSSADVVAAVRFAARHRLRVAIKGTGHDYLGRSNAKDSLLVWTHPMRDVSVQDSFVPAGCASSEAAVPAVTVGAGTRWIEVYRAVGLEHGRFVQGGGCNSVGAAGGFVQGGGFGGLSKKFGSAASNMLEAEVVTADGRLLTANRCQNQELFWALRGGGGGTFGVVTRMTMRTHPLPASFGAVLGVLTAKRDADFKELLEHFVALYGKALSNEHWGEQVKVRRNNTLQVAMLFQGITTAEAEAAWQPLRSWMAAYPDRFNVQLQTVAAPATLLWDLSALQKMLPDLIEKDTSTGGAGRFWWKSNQSEVATYWQEYESRWLPLDQFSGAAAKRLADTLFEASRHWTLELYFNKGLGGASKEALARGRESSLNPVVYEAAALVIVAATGSGYPGVTGHEPDRKEAEENRAEIRAAMKLIRAATPKSGTYPNEASYFEADWQRSFWGDNYPKLLEVKRKYDPLGLFFCHHCVGSEAALARSAAPSAR